MSTAKNRQTCLRLIASMLLIVFAGFYVSRTMMTHTHVEDGIVITHSHPFNTPGHSHSHNDYVSIAFVSGSAQQSQIDLSAVFFGAPAVVSVLLTAPGYSPAAGHARHGLNRGPPMV